jgi:hypothetical protein
MATARPAARRTDSGTACWTILKVRL